MGRIGIKSLRRGKLEEGEQWKMLYCETLRQTLLLTWCVTSWARYKEAELLHHIRTDISSLWKLMPMLGIWPEIVLTDHSLSLFPSSNLFAILVCFTGFGEGTLKCSKGRIQMYMVNKSRNITAFLKWILNDFFLSQLVKGLNKPGHKLQQWALFPNWTGL